MIELSDKDMVVLGKTGKPFRRRWPSGVFRFKRGELVWVRDHVHPKKGNYVLNSLENGKD